LRRREYIRIFHAKDDDPAGLLALCIVITILSIVLATAAGVFEPIVENGVGLSSENEQLSGQLKK